jgi:hypothetical protein
LLPPELETQYGATEIADRLLKRRSIRPHTGCWCWTGARTRDGYGLLHLRRGGPKQLYTVHRLAAMLWLDLAPTGRQSVLHHCDQPDCFNPAHLFLGDNRANVRDMRAKGRHRFGTHPGQSNGRAKLSESAVMEARRLFMTGQRSITSLARENKVTYEAMSQAIRGQTWRHVANSETADRRRSADQTIMRRGTAI